jgi:DNA mismatch repair protein MutL
VFEAIYYTVRQALESNTTRPEIGESAFTPTTPSQKMTGMSQGAVRVSEMTAPIDTREESLKKRQLSWSTPAPATPEQKPPQMRITAEDYVKQYLGMKKESKSEQPTVKKEEALRIEDTMQIPPPPEMPTGYGEKDIPVPPLQKEEIAESVIPAYRVVGEVFNTYVLVEMDEKMLIIDKHAAHERLIFERLKANLKKGSVDTQLLMIPVEVVLMSAEVALIREYSRELEDIGFSFTCMKNTVEVSGIPSGIEPGAVSDMFAAFVKNISEGVGDARLTRDIIFERALYQASCKAAIKGGREYPTEQIGHLVDQLMRIPDITVCPHGRPVAMEMKKRTLDRQFERC